jgi:hypothetical protein
MTPSEAPNPTRRKMRRCGHHEGAWRLQLLITTPQQSCPIPAARFLISVEPRNILRHKTALAAAVPTPPRQRMLCEGELPWQQPELIQRARAGPPMGTLWCLPRRRVLVQPAIEPVFRGPKLPLKKLPDLPSLLAHIALFSS